ncbi:PAS domain-containing sensor histidine kinase [Phenylobacterium sp.]|uniref:PAS domain-containing sensor histidine kinase n=1 Tax=Phenylobacterium sp. TaxID=1871053 RepID=UPI0025EAB266|nr:PAS domain-containing sensor histidine kinase [Phenylobacterium sp.]
MSENLVASPPPAAAKLPDLGAVFDHAPAPLLLVAADAPKYTMLRVNLAHARAFNSTPEALAGWGVLEVFPADPPPEVAGFVEAIRTSFERVIATGAADQMPVRPFSVALDDGQAEQRYWSATNAPILGPDGVVTHIVSAVRDVTGEVLERRSEEARKLLMREVDHRARNALTIVQSFVRLTTADSLDQFRETVDGRVASLARAQTSLAARRWEGGDLREVVDSELAAMSATGRYRVSGPAVLLQAEHVQAMSMVIHELATNAGKYGALSSAGGMLAVTWTADPDGRLRLTWQEDGGPPARPPSREGFGSRLIVQLSRQLNGEVAFEWRPEGLKVEMDLRLGETAQG